MSEYMFCLGRGYLPDEAEVVARGVDDDVRLVNYREPGGPRRHWFAGPNRGHPFDVAMSDEVHAALLAAKLVDKDGNAVGKES